MVADYLTEDPLTFSYVSAALKVVQWVPFYVLLEHFNVKERTRVQ